MRYLRIGVTVPMLLLAGATIAQYQQAKVVDWRAQTPVMTYDAAGRKQGLRKPSDFAIAKDAIRDWNPQYDLVEITDGVWVDSSELKLEFCGAKVARSTLPAPLPMNNNGRGGRSSGADCGG